jgi:predicted acyl esterase
MADNLPLNFPIPGSPVIASFDGSEIATGSQFITFYLCDLYVTATDTKMLTENIVYSDEGISESQAAQDIDFDLEFVRPMTIQGDAKINIFLSSSGNNSSAVTCKLYHVSAAGVETQIGTTASKTQSFGNDTRVWGIKQVIAKTRFVNGEKFRISITAAATVGAQWVGILHDPKNRLLAPHTPNALGSASLINIPIRLSQ